MARLKKCLVLLGGITAAVLISSQFLGTRSAQAERRKRTVRQQFSPTDFRPQQVVKAYPAIVDPPNVTADQVNNRVQPTELVLGVELDGESRAYPINMLTGPSREIFNDTLGQRSIAATW